LASHSSAVRLLWISQSPTLLTGFGHVTREVLCRLARLPGFTVAAVAWEYSGWPYDRKWIPFDLYPSTGAAHGSDTLERAIAEFRPNIVVGFGDLWMIEYLSNFRLPPSCRLVVHYPLDGEPFPKAAQRLVCAADVAVCVADYGAEHTRAICPNASVERIYHGVDRRVFRPLGPKEEVKERRGLGGKFVIGCVARNQPRKGFPILIEAFSRFAAGHDDAMLYLHTDPNDVGWDIMDLLNRHGVASRTCVSRFAAVVNGYDGRTMNEIYNLFDVMALPTAGEGFGLPILESMAAGTPVIVTDFSAAAELVRGRGELIKVREKVTVGRYNVQQAVPDMDDLVSCMERVYASRRLRARHRRAGLAFARELDWKNIMPQWKQLFEGLVAAPSYAAAGA